MKYTSIRKSSRSGVAGLAVLGLVSSFGALSLLTAPAASAAGSINDLVINEIESNGDLTNGDWIELHNNNTTDSVDLTGAILSDNDNTHSITISGTVPANGFATFRVDDAATPGNFGLGGADSARLYASGATVGVTTAVDSYSWTNHAVTTYGRYPDGAGAKNGTDFFTTSASTYNAANAYTPPVNPSPTALAGIVINEVESSGDSVNGNWIELRNTKAIGSVNLSGAILSDNNNGHTFTIPSGTTIAAGQYKAFVVEDAAGVGAFGLGVVDSARLFVAGTTDLATATAVDSFSWNTHSPTTYGRVPNGTGAFTNTSASTFGAANGSAGSFTSLAGNVVINEVESNLDPAGDWVELYNKSGSNQKIEGAAIADSDNTHVFSIPVGTPDLAPGGYVAFRVDDSSVDGSFGLGASDSARLYDAGSNIGVTAPVDSYTWTSHASTTYGRIPNGTGSFTTTTAGTFAAANS